MNKYKEINLEEGMPTVEEAMSYLKMSITLCKQNKIGCLAVIHGYGSSGKGGAIRAKARQWLNAQVRNGTIKAVINGEDFDVLNFKALELKNKYKELEKLTENLPIQHIVVDPSAASFIETVRRHGRFTVKKAKNDVIDGIRYTAGLISAGKILISPACENTLREFEE